MVRAAAPLPRREQQVMDVLHRARQATVGEIVEQLESEMTYSAVRSVLRVLVQKGLVRRRYVAPRYVYAPAARTETARAAALDYVVRTFFDGSSAAAAVALLRSGDLELSERDLKNLEELIERAEKEGR